VHDKEANIKHQTSNISHCSENAISQFGLAFRNKSLSRARLLAEDHNFQITLDSCPISRRGVARRGAAWHGMAWRGVEWRGAKGEGVPRLGNELGATKSLSSLCSSIHPSNTTQWVAPTSPNKYPSDAAVDA
jgi:hypothetical protein